MCIRDRCKIKWNRCCKNWQKFTKTCSASVKMPCNNMLIAKNMINSGRGIGMREALITIAIIVIRGLHCCVVECETMTWTCATSGVNHGGDGERCSSTWLTNVCSVTPSLTYCTPRKPVASLYTRRESIDWMTDRCYQSEWLSLTTVPVAYVREKGL